MNALKSLLVFPGIAFANAAVDAQIDVTYRSLEARIARADSVLHGPISQVSRKVVIPAGGHRKDGAPWPDGSVEYTLTITVEDVLKGEPQKEIKLQRETSAFDKRFDQWGEAHTSFLWFIGEATADKKADMNRSAAGAADASTWDAMRLGKHVAAEAHYRTDAPPLFSMDLTVLKAPAEILTRARAFAKTPSRTAQVHAMVIPHSVAERCGASGDLNTLVVPVAPSLEQTARRLLASPLDFMPKGHELDSLSRYQLRQAGVNALTFFKSAENTLLLKSLLDDPTAIRRTFDSGDRRGTTVKEYSIRSSAFRILNTWGVDVLKPVLEEVVPKSLADQAY